MSYSIGAVAKALNLPTRTIRSWEARYGWPVPLRDERGNRHYSISDVERIRAVLKQKGSRALAEVMDEEKARLEEGALELVKKYAMLVRRFQACLQDGPEAWMREAARKEREACLIEARELALLRSRLVP